MNRSSKFVLFLLTVLISLPAQSQNAELFFKAAGSPANPKVQASWNKYYTYDGISITVQYLID